MNMNKTLAFTAFVMFAVIMGMSAVAPAMAEAGGESGNNPPNSTACDKIADNKSNDKANDGQDKAAANVCDEN